ncbi:hypothetical protein M3Y99_01806500 [Aphelenchoides fujianensis]|nr:hypothetical protein M3Y99_01806500 [Aphelenchoides fujianensis]
MLALNFTLICMSPPLTANSSATADGYLTFNWNSYHKNALMWSVAIGSMLGTLPFNLLYTRYGARWPLFFAGLISAFSTVLIPLAARTSFNFFLVLRVIQGVSYAADFSAMGMLVSRWASLKQNAFFISVLTCYSPLSSILTNSISGVVCESRFRWPAVFYGHSVVCVLLFGLWALLYDDHPQRTPFVSNVELEKINRGKSKSHVQMDKFVPYKAICTAPVILVVWLNAFADLFSGMFLLMYAPSYFKYVLNFSVENTGIIGIKLLLRLFCH